MSVCVCTILCPSPPCHHCCCGTAKGGPFLFHEQLLKAAMGKVLRGHQQSPIGNIDRSKLSRCLATIIRAIYIYRYILSVNISKQKRIYIFTHLYTYMCPYQIKNLPLNLHACIYSINVQICMLLVCVKRLITYLNPQYQTLRTSVIYLGSKIRDASGCLE